MRVNDLPLIARRHVTAIAFVFYLLLGAVVLGARPYRGQIAGPFDLLLSRSGWGGELAAGQVRNAERGDVLDFYLPRWIYSRQVLRQGHLPLWNPLAAGGEPALLNLANGELTPGFAVFALSPDPAYGFYAAVVLNLALGGAGAFYFLSRRLRLLAAAFGGATFMLCGFNAAWLYWPHVSTAIWICWLLGSLDRCWYHPDFSRMLAVAASLFLMLLGGFPFVALLGIGAAALLLLCLGFIETPQSWHVTLKYVAAGLVCGFALATPGLLGFGEWLTQFDLGYRTGGSFLAGVSNMKFLLRGVANSQPAVESTMYAGRVAELFAAGMALLVIALFIVHKRRPRLLEIFVFVLGIVAIVLVFQIVSPMYLVWIPGLGKNGWSRAICILDLAIAIAAAATLDIFGTLMRRSLFVPLAVVLLALQIRDASQLFRQFNGPVPASMFYPRMALLDNVRAHTHPFQSSIADDNFIISGTLGAYGIAEWFGHGFKTNALKSVLQTIVDDPFDSPTSSSIEAETFRLDSPAINALAVRYVLADGGVFSRPLEPFGIATPAPQLPLPAMPTHRLVQSFVLDRAITMSGFHLLMATFNRSNQKGMLRFTFAGPDMAIPPRVWSMPVQNILDDQSYFFQLPMPIKLEKGRYELGMAYEGASAGDLLTIWSSPGAWGDCRLIVDEEVASGCMSLRLDVPRENQAKSFSVIDRVKGIYLLENRNAPAGAYYLPTLGAFPSRNSSDSVKLLSYANHEYKVRYEGKDPGFVVFPMNFRRDWHVYVGEKRVWPEKYLGILPAVMVSGACAVEFFYRPLALTIGVPVFVMTLFLLLACSWRERSSRLRLTRTTMAES